MTHLAWKYVQVVGGVTCLDFAKIPEPSFAVLFENLERVFVHSHRVWFCASRPLDNLRGGDIAAFLSRLLEASQTVTELHLSSLPLSPSDFESLALSISKSPLSSLVLEDVDVGDAALQQILRALRPNQLKNAILTNCRITDASFRSIIWYVSRKHAEVMAFRVEGDGFTRGREVTEKVLKCCGLPEPPSDIAEIEEENAKLRRRIESLRNMVNPVVSGDCTFVAGPNARKFAKRLNGICRELDRTLDL